MMKRKTARMGTAVMTAMTLLLLAVTLSGCAGMGAVSKSVADRVLPTQQRTVYAHTPDPGSYDESYADASGTGMDYIYDVAAVTDDGTPITVTLIFFGSEASGEGWIEIQAKGTSGVYYQSIEENEVPQKSLDTLGAKYDGSCGLQSLPAGC